MPLPSRQKELYEKVRQHIREKYLPGMILPSEPEYAHILGCGRTTLRKVLALLQEENLIRRTHRGTFVLEENPTSSASLLKKEFGNAGEEERPLFLLLPCIGYTEKVDDFSLSIHHRVMAGAMREAIRCGSHLVTLPVSETNRTNGIECIDFAMPQLKSLRQGDKVLFFGRWFRQLLPALAEKGCHIAYISQLPIPFEEQLKNLQTVTAFTGYSTSAFILKALEELKKQGKRSVECIYFSLDEEEKKGVEEIFHSFLKANEMQGELHPLSFWYPREEKSSFIAELAEKKGSIMESLVICPYLRPDPFPLSLTSLPRHILTVCDPGLAPKLEGKNPLVILRDDLEINAGFLAGALLKGEFATPLPYPYQKWE